MTDRLPEPIHWKSFWETDHAAEDWLVEPILPLGRSVSMYSPPKVGKSLLALDVAARAACGWPIFGQVLARKLSVVYIDLEMTEDDLAERLEDMGHGPDSDFGSFHYYLLPALPALDTREGGEMLREIVRLHKADLVIIDTTSRVISGPENEADTLRALYKHTGILLKQEKVTVWRLDHAGKNLERGQRGTSAKNDDVDLVWELSGSETAYKLKATHRRQSWIPENVNLTRVDNPFRHEIVEDLYPSGTVNLVRVFEELNIPEDWGAKRVRRALRDEGRSARNELITAAIRYRKKHSKNIGTPSGTPLQLPMGTP